MFLLICLLIISIILGSIIDKLAYKISKTREGNKTLKISLILTFVAGLSFIYSYGFTIKLTLYMCLIYWLILISIVDIYIQTIEDYLILPASLFLIILDLVLSRNLNLLVYNLINGSLSFGLMYFIYFISRGKLGGADVKIYFIIGYIFDFIASLNILFISSLLALGYYIIVYIIKDESNIILPFIPFITGGVILNNYISFIYL